jgi:hypothetical protein
MLCQLVLVSFLGKLNLLLQTFQLLIPLVDLTLPIESLCLDYPQFYNSILALVEGSTVISHNLQLIPQRVVVFAVDTNHRLPLLWVVRDAFQEL